MAFQRIQPTKLSDVIMQRIEVMIVDGTLEAGARLPSERDLAHQFSVSRPSLREAIQKLEARGLLERRQGGGTYVCDNMQKRVAEPLLELLTQHPESQFDLLEFRHALEGISSYYAAMRGTPTDIARIEESFAAIKQDDNAELTAQAEALNEFNLRICEASHNVILLHLVRSMQPLLQKVFSKTCRTCPTRRASCNNFTNTGSTLSLPFQLASQNKRAKLVISC